MVKGQQVKVLRDPLSAVILTELPEWEIPVIEEVFGDGNILRVRSVDLPKQAPDASAEFDRLAQVYGGNGNPRVPFVEQVYGPGTLGKQRLAEQIEKATLEEAPEADPLLA